MLQHFFSDLALFLDILDGKFENKHPVNRLDKVDIRITQRYKYLTNFTIIIIASSNK